MPDPATRKPSSRPIMVLLALLGRRWTLRVIWELRGDAPLTFRELQRSCDEMSSSVLSRRLAELKRADIVAVVRDGYVLTARGRELLALFGPLNAWAEAWARRAGDLPPEG
ncbi:MAG TPA: helix-turn-helix domain-containing protein [Solirubrobacteraceae bacterium]|nr:helix-turn-helix domain-containing protein [Solirubrobacteraceae bacterium]